MLYVVVSRLLEYDLERRKYQAHKIPTTIDYTNNTLSIRTAANAGSVLANAAIQDRFIR